MSWRRTAACGGFLWVATWACVEPVVAQQQTPASEPREVTEARRLFAEGVELADRERWEEAEQRFREAQRLRPSPSIAYNLALTLGRLGRLVEAHGLLERVIADAAATAEVRAGATRRRDELSAFIGRIVVRLGGSTDGVRITLDGRAVDVAQLAEPLLVDPGRHEIVASRGGREIAREAVTVNEQSLRVEVSLVLPEAREEGDGAPLRASDGRPEDDRDASAGGNTAGWVVGVSLLGGGAVAGAAGIWALVTDGDCAGGRRDADGDCERIHDRTPAAVGLLVGAGVGLAAGGLVLLLTGRRSGSEPDEEGAVEPEVTATPLSGGFAIGVRGRL